jgi:hypothetical protein
MKKSCCKCFRSAKGSKLSPCFKISEKYELKEFDSSLYFNLNGYVCTMQSFVIDLSEARLCVGNLEMIKELC